MCCGSLNLIYSQVPELLHSINISQPESVSIDRFNNIYITDTRGEIIQYDLKGKVLQKYSPLKPVKITSLEAWQAIKIFVFSRDLQQIIFMDRFLTPSPVIKLQDLSVGFIRTATISVDNNFWLVDDSDLSLKKYDVLQQKLIINTPLNLMLTSASFDINFAREYQNHLFINDKKNGILMFDVLGNYLKTLPVKNLNYFNFFNDELYFLDEGKVTFYNFYKLQEKNIDIPSHPYRFVLKTVKNLILISNTKLDVYKL
jgi:hypothetical protein